jgi:hydroxymethylpyrimidine pyrophosphatase-like HAD family hydrolase
MKDVIGIGDELNDISMIEMAGLGVAMENALDEVKAVANEVTKTNTENGVAHIINKYILN